MLPIPGNVKECLITLLVLGFECLALPNFLFSPVGASMRSLNCYSRRGFRPAEQLLDSSPILLPKEYDPVAKLNELESLNSFLAKNTNLEQMTSPKPKMKQQPLKKPRSLGKELTGRRIVRDMQVIGCILLELFMPKKFVILGRHASLKARYVAELGFSKLHSKTILELGLRDS